MIIPHKNRESFRQLVDVMRSPRRPIAMLGAGISAAAGYPTWAELLTRMHQRLHGQLSENNTNRRQVNPRYLFQLSKLEDLPWRAEEYRTHLGEKAFEEELVTAFSRPVRSPNLNLLEAVTDLQFRHLMTTNYESSFEDKYQEKHSTRKLNVIDWTDRRSVQRFFRAVGDETDPYFVYLHGRLTSESKLILCERDYVERYLASDDTAKKLFALFALHSIVFIGFSLTDPDLMPLLRLAYAHVGFDSPRHFAFLGLDNEDDDQLVASKFRGKYGVEPIFFRRGENYRHLTDLVNDLEKAISLPADRLDTFIAQSKCGSVDDLSPSSKQASANIHDDDPRKGQFGGSSKRPPFELSAVVVDTEDKDWFEFTIKLTCSDNEIKLPETATLFLHPTFHPDEVTVPFSGRTVLYRNYAWGAFTVGAQIFEHKLELDLAQLEDAPITFRNR